MLTLLNLCLNSKAFLTQFKFKCYAISKNNKEDHPNFKNIPIEIKSMNTNFKQQ